MTSLILRRPLESCSILSSFSALGSVGRVTSSASFEGRKAGGTLGTGGAFLGLADRLGVPGREPLVLRGVEDFAGEAAGFGSEPLKSGMAIGAVAFALRLRLASRVGDAS